MSQAADAYLELPAGQAVYAEGDSGSTMYIIEAGTVDLLLAARGAEPIASYGPGDFFGEASMLAEQPRFSSAIVRKPVRLLKIERAGFANLLARHVEIGIAIICKLAQRHQQCELRLASALLEAAQKRKPTSAPPREPARAAPAAPGETLQQSARLEPPPSRTTIEPPRASPPVAKLRGGCALKHAKGSVFALDPALNEFLVGRPDPRAGINPEIDLSEVDPTRSLSRRHARLVRQGQLFFVREDARTVNGTFVNNVRIGTGVDVPVKPGDTLRFGAVEVEFSAA